MKKLALALALSAAAFGAQAVTSSTVGNVTTYTDNFNHGSDGYDTLSILTGYTYSFDFVTTGTSALDLSFWYSAPSWGGGTVTLASSAFNLDGTTGFIKFLANNPGADNGSAIAKADSFFSKSLTGLSAGNYTLTITPNSFLSAVKIDDVKLVVTSVPEPESYAMFLAGLGIMGVLVRRRRNNG